MTVLQPDKDWQKFLSGSLETLVGGTGMRFVDMSPARVTDNAGIYLITGLERNLEVPYYVGQSGCLAERLYRNHLMGQPQSNARLKRYLIHAEQCADASEAKQFLLDHCAARWIEEPNGRRRTALEGYVSGILFPKYGLGFETPT